MTRDELESFLRERGVPIDTWGHGTAKTIDHLLRELNAGESTLTEAGGVLTRSAAGCLVNVYYFDGIKAWLLREDRQVFTDGREKTRADLAGSVGEKLKPGEDPHRGVERALYEELGILDALPLIERPGSTKGPKPSVSFPGLMVVYTNHCFDVVLPTRHFRPEGYVEQQDDKTTYFVWDSIPDDRLPR